MSEKLLITGGAGFIGSSLIESLISNRYELIIVDKKEKPNNLSKIINDIIYLKIDIRDYNKLEDIIVKYKPLGIIHLAAISRVVWCERNPVECVDININGTLNILKAIAKLTYKPFFIYGSSREVYGEQNKFPVKETAPKMPINIYGYSKLIGEILTRNFHQQYKIPSIILRFSNVYGNEYDILDRVIPKFIIRTLKKLPLEIHGGNQIFDFTYIEDTIDGIKKAINKLLKEENYMNDFHILTGIPTRITDLPKIIFNEVGYKVPIIYKSRRTYDVEKFYGDPIKAYKELGFKSKIDIKLGIKYTVRRLRGIIK